MGYAGFLAAVPWIQAFIWAFKPTDIVDIRRFPVAEAKGIDEEIARLKGEEPVPVAAEPVATDSHPHKQRIRRPFAPLIRSALGLLLAGTFVGCASNSSWNGQF